MPDVGERFGANVKAIRKSAAISQEELAALASIHRTVVGLIERRGRLPRIDTLMKLAGALEAEPNELLAGIVWIPAPHRVGSFSVGSPSATGREPGGWADGR